MKGQDGLYAQHGVAEKQIACGREGFEHRSAPLCVLLACAACPLRAPLWQSPGTLSQPFSRGCYLVIQLVGAIIRLGVQ